MAADFDALVAEALAEPTEGWNLARFGARMQATHPSWRYWDLVAGPAASAPPTSGSWRTAPCARASSSSGSMP